MTYLQLVNNILVRLREDEVGSVNENHYSKLVGAFVNDAKEVVEDSWQWLTLQETVEVSCESGIASYDLEDYLTKTFSNQISNRARLWRDLDTGYPLVYCVTANKERMLDGVESTNSIVVRAQKTNEGETGEPCEYFFTNNATAAETKTPLRFNLYPTPDGVYTYRILLVNPQPTLSTDTTVVRVPSQPVIQLAYLYCLYERGEELGESLTLTAQKATASLSDAISLDQAGQGTNLEFTNA